MFKPIRLLKFVIYISYVASLIIKRRGRKTVATRSHNNWSGYFLLCTPLSLHPLFSRIEFLFCFSFSNENDSGSRSRI